MSIRNERNRKNLKEVNLKLDEYTSLTGNDFILLFWLLLYRYNYNQLFSMNLNYFSKVGMIKFEDCNFDWNYIDVKDYFELKIAELEDGNIECNNVFFYINKSELDITFIDESIQIVFEIIENHNDRKGKLCFNSDFVTQESIDSLIKNFYWFLQQINANKNMTINTYEIVCPDEKKKIESFNNREIICHYTENFIEKYEKKLKDINNHIAIVYGCDSYSYQEINNIANKIAAIVLRSKSKYIGIYSENDICTMVSILAILKAGKCIVTINPSYPENRVLKILNELNMDMILCCNKQKNKNINTSISENLISIENFDTEYIYPEICEKVSKDDPCYIIFTSGTTGEPKGVVISQENIMLEIEWLIRYFAYGNFVRSLHILSYSFDFGLYDILSTILCGGTLFCIDKTTIKNFGSYIDFINNNEINNINVTPSFFNVIASFGELLPTLRYVHLGGEKVTYRYIEKYNKVLSEECKIYNGYGPCECTVGCLIHEVTCEEKKQKVIGMASVPIGKPTDESYIYILDKKGMFVPINAIGEIYVVGKSVGKGYVNKKLNVGKFFEIDGEKAFATGDMAKWLTTGEVEFLNRKDTQVKINGFRVELSEIDIAMENLKSVEASKTVYSGKLISYVILREKMSILEIRNELSKVLPYYMIPTKIIFISEFPCLESGKIDMQKLGEMA